MCHNGVCEAVLMHVSGVSSMVPLFCTTFCRTGVLWAGNVTHILLDLLRLNVDSTCFSTDISLFGALVDVSQLFNVFFTCIPAFVPIHKVCRISPLKFC
jgi:hypothetical protein